MDLGDLGNGTFALLILYVVVRDVVTPLVKKRNGQAGCNLDAGIKTAIYESRRQVEQMEKAAERQIRAIENLHEAITALRVFLSSKMRSP
jgi:ABC-type transport system involved in cytochrome bd biosynthesis fused ATPase/permease subunit